MSSKAALKAKKHPHRFFAALLSPRKARELRKLNRRCDLYPKRRSPVTGRCSVSDRGLRYVLERQQLALDCERIEQQLLLRWAMGER